MGDLMPDSSLLFSISSWFDVPTQWFQDLEPYIAGVLVAAAALYLAFIGWRAFKASTNKV